MISISHSPNSNLRQYLKSLGYLLLPWRWLNWRQGSKVALLEHNFAQYQKVPEAIAFSKGRGALLAVLKALDIGEGDEVIIQGYTCIVVPNAVIWSGAKPVYADIDSSLNLAPDQLEQKISSATTAVIVQHTFGVPADVQAIKSICDKHNLKLIEDCAHSLGARVGEGLVGNFGDAAIFSFGRDKIISSVSGGMAIARDNHVSERLRQMQASAKMRPRKWVFQNLIHPLTIPWMSRVIDIAKLGQALIRLTQAMKLTNKVYTSNEKLTAKDETLIYQMPNAMADLAVKQVRSIEQFNIHRRETAKKYVKFCRKNGINFQQVPENVSPAFLRFTMLLNKPDDVRKFARNSGFLLGDWYSKAIIPMPKQPEQVDYQRGSCLQSEQAASQSVNLPTNRKMTAKKVRQLLAILEKIL